MSILITLSVICPYSFADEWKSVCNACALYYKFHRTERPRDKPVAEIRRRNTGRRIKDIRSTKSAVEHMIAEGTL